MISSLLSAIEIVKKMWNTLSVREMPKNADKLIQRGIFSALHCGKGDLGLKDIGLRRLI